MRGPRVVAGIAVATVVAGLGVALVARLWSGGAAAVGPIPAAAMAFPADARLLAGVDLARLRESPLYERYAARLAAALPGDVLGPLAGGTGADPLRDLDRVLVAWLPGTGDGLHGLAHVRGRLGAVPDRLAAGGLTSRSRPGATTWALGEIRGVPAALALLDDGSALVGDTSAVEATLDSLSRGEAPLRGNAALLDLAGELPAGGGSLWLVGDGALLAELGDALGSGSGLGLSLPPVAGIAASAEPSPQIAIDVVALAHDEAGARRLADTVRGVLALASLQAARIPELGEAASAVSVATEARRVRIGARLPLELFDGLGRLSGPAGPGPSGDAQ